MESIHPTPVLLCSLSLSAPTAHVCQLNNDCTVYLCDNHSGHGSQIWLPTARMCQGIHATYTFLWDVLPKGSSSTKYGVAECSYTLSNLTIGRHLAAVSFCTVLCEQ